MGNSQAQLGNASRGRVAVIARVLGRLTELVNNRLRWRIIWIAHAKIDDVLSGPPRLHLQLIDDGKYIGWQTINTRKFLHDAPQFSVFSRHNRRHLLLGRQMLRGLVSRCPLGITAYAYTVSQTLPRHGGRLDPGLVAFL